MGHIPRVRHHDASVAAVSQPSGTVTLVFTDIEGSTRLLEQLGTDGYRAALAEHRRIVRQACALHDGYEVGTEGDSFFLAFANADAAVAAIGEAMQGLDGGPIRIRVGVHTGEPSLDPPNYIGLDVHRAARIMSAAHGGQAVLSRATVGCSTLPSRCATWATPPQGPQRTRSRSTSSGRRAPRPVPAPQDAVPRQPPRPRHPLPRPRTELAEVVAAPPTPTRACSPSPAPAAPARPGSPSRQPPTQPTTTPTASPGSRSPRYETRRSCSPRSPRHSGSATNPRRPPTHSRRPPRQAALLLLDNAEHLLPEVAADLGRSSPPAPPSRCSSPAANGFSVAAADHEYPGPSRSSTRRHRPVRSPAAETQSVLLVRRTTTTPSARRTTRPASARDRARGRALPLFPPGSSSTASEQRLDLLEGGRDTDPRSRPPARQSPGRTTC